MRDLIGNTASRFRILPVQQGVRSVRRQLDLGVWNVRWASPRSKRSVPLLEHISAWAADVVVLTEVGAPLLSEGHRVTSGNDYGYGIQRRRRKVVLWSRNPWTDVDAIGHATLPPGRFVAGTTLTPLGPVRVLGVCIPWAAAHVSSGRKNRARWEDHLAYLKGLHRVLDRLDSSVPVVVAGDFNQHLPRKREPRKAHDALLNCFESLAIVTTGDVPNATGPLIDHLAVSNSLTASERTAIPRLDPEYGLLSDHDGLRVVLRACA